MSASPEARYLEKHMEGLNRDLAGLDKEEKGAKQKYRYVKELMGFFARDYGVDLTRRLIETIDDSTRNCLTEDEEEFFGFWDKQKKYISNLKDFNKRRAQLEENRNLTLEELKKLV